MVQKTVGFLFTAGVLLAASFPVYAMAGPLTGGIAGPAADTTILGDSGSAPDYSETGYWAAIPGKKGPADSIPEPLRSISLKDTGVDVFFLHPTTFTASSDTGWNAEMEDSEINKKTDYSTILFQASAFNECRVFAPRYRQAHIRAYFSGDKAAAQKAFDLAYGDIRAAFEYYLAHYNQGRPIIIASHSQGTTHALRLLKEFFENGPLKDRLVAAYIIGMPLPVNYFTGLSPCSDSTQTGCFVGWRTYLEGYVPEYIKQEDPRSFVVNPLTWTMTEDRATRDLNRGSVLRSFNKTPKRVVDAQIHEGVLWVHRPHFTGSILLRTKNYHIGDINLFYLSIRNNVRTRIRYYRQRHGDSSARARL